VNFDPNFAASRLRFGKLNDLENFRTTELSEPDRLQVVTTCFACRSCWSSHGCVGPLNRAHARAGIKPCSFVMLTTG